MRLTEFILFTFCFGLLTLFANCQTTNQKSIDYYLTGNIKGVDTGWIY